MAPRVPIPLREIVYTLSPYQQEVFVNGIYKMPRKIAHFVQRHAFNGTVFATILFGPIAYGNWYKEQEKLESRY